MVNKFIYFGTTCFDLTEDTVAADKLISGITAHGKDGKPLVGTLVLQNFRTGSTPPDNSIGSDGDLFLLI